MSNSILNSPWLWGPACLAVGIGVGAFFFGTARVPNPVLELNELRSEWILSCIRNATPQNYPAPPEAINNCTEKGLKVIPVDQKLLQEPPVPPVVDEKF